MKPEELEVGKTYASDHSSHIYTYVGKDEPLGWVFRKESHDGTAYEYINFQRMGVSWLKPVPVPEPFFEPGKTYRYRWDRKVRFTVTDIVAHPDTGKRWALGWELNGDDTYRYPGSYANFDNWTEV